MNPDHNAADDDEIVRREINRIMNAYPTYLAHEIGRVLVATAAQFRKPNIEPGGLNK